MMTTGLAREFLLGVGSGRETGYLGFLSPVMQIYSSFRPHIERAQDESGTLISCRLEGLWVVALYALAGAAMLALAWFLYQKRHSESAGDVVAFQWLRPVFRYGSALLGGLTVGRLLFEVFWETLFQRGYSGDRIPLWVCLFLGGLLGYYIASMLLEKSLRVFRGSWKGAVSVCLAAAALCAGLALDPLGISSWVPEAEDIQIAWVYGEAELHAGPEDAPERKEMVIDLHRAILAEKDSIRARSDRLMDNHLWLGIVYVLEDGRTVQRAYSLPMREEQWETGESYEGLVRDIAGDREAMRSQIAAPEGYALADITAESGYGAFYAAVGDNPAETDPDAPGAEELYAALFQDLEEGNIPSWAPSFVGRSSARVPVQLELRFEERVYHSDRRSTAVRYVELYESMVHTIQTMEDMGWGELFAER